FLEKREGVMDIQPRDVEHIRFIADNYTATTDQVKCAVYPENADTTVARRRSRKLLAEGLINVTRAETVTLRNNVHVPVFYPSRKGVELLALKTGEMKYLLTPTRPPYSQHLAHFVALTDLRVRIKKAVAAQDFYRLDQYYNQFD